MTAARTGRPHCDKGVVGSAAQRARSCASPDSSARRVPGDENYRRADRATEVAAFPAPRLRLERRAAPVARLFWRAVPWISSSASMRRRGAALRPAREGARGLAARGSAYDLVEQAQGPAAAGLLQPMAQRPRAARAPGACARSEALASQGLGLGGGLLQAFQGPCVASPRDRAGARAWGGASRMVQSLWPVPAPRRLVGAARGPSGAIVRASGRCAARPRSPPSFTRSAAAREPLRRGGSWPLLLNLRCRLWSRRQSGTARSRAAPRGDRDGADWRSARRSTAAVRRPSDYASRGAPWAPTTCVRYSAPMVTGARPLSTGASCPPCRAPWAVSEVPLGIPGGLLIDPRLRRNALMRSPPTPRSLCVVSFSPLSFLWKASRSCALRCIPSLRFDLLCFALFGMVSLCIILRCVSLLCFWLVGSSAIHRVALTSIELQLYVRWPCLTRRRASLRCFALLRVAASGF